MCEALKRTAPVTDQSFQSASPSKHLCRDLSPAARSSFQTKQPPQNPPTWTSIQTRAARRRRHRHRRNPLRPPRPPRPPRPLPPPRPPRRLEPRIKSPRRRQAPRRRSNRDNRAPRGRPRHPQGPALPASGGLSDLHIALPNAIWWPSSLTPSPSNQTACASSMRGMLTRGERLTRFPGSLRRIRC